METSEGIGPDMKLHRDDKVFIAMLTAIALIYVCAIIAWLKGVEDGRRMRERWQTTPTIAEIASDGFKGGFLE